MDWTSEKSSRTSLVAKPPQDSLRSWLLKLVAADGAKFARCIIHPRIAFGTHFEAIAYDSAVPLRY